MTEQNLEKLQTDLVEAEQRLAAIIDSFIELGVSVYDFPGTEDSMQGMVTNLKRNVDRMKQLNQQANDPESQLQNFLVPLDVLQYIEDGRNPDVYTREFVEAIRRSNQYQRAKIHGLIKLRDSLAEKIVDELPDLQPHVERIIARTSPEKN
ncbi:Mediator of RNA polymerase II transcription subunit 10 [Kluyveromyces marxianus]|uniref:Mediator of RNA polymerase II transcription subunit 10 n=2 Tax=Kluyveromyces marxianus TaxID=4911 RepID=W0TFG1_KLUMD|nr:mediator of RNA polymerase II transcription subunit 10 [Kluyveromyces marxianus DMKU3-1042]KAG0678686.1 RNA polymerase II mediator complex subunit [Kluyveromyces marxianus]KAG0684680.1 RNA polymerase II mediator complex subunit [Kluyveromyces marxianus]QGN18254.1 mediator of RNA polymerase II transcription subunit 10 [Kluyveromyces marxianus]BAO42120.1 mediator of RNA polymerase II transcription subunit 10 [Kluyveromyces marxianus DMKU3-1042]BAP73532.1 mediator of RNA polymerase II transcri